QKQKKLIMLPSETMIWQPEFTDKTLSRKPGAVQTDLPPTSPHADEADLEVAHNAVAERPSMTYSCLFKIILIDYP
ncbi:hypothetical protein NEP09_13320, partial [Escherichia coli]|nr:hypothetical protein [Escherichia coli]MDI0750064.1 hypothetical protein [Escherichia coli]